MPAKAWCDYSKKILHSNEAQECDKHKCFHIKIFISKGDNTQFVRAYPESKHESCPKPEVH